MLYLLFALTFLAGILFYGMSPREDKLNLDTNQAEGMIVSFLNQHQAAKDYVYAWMGVGPNDGTALSNVKQELQNESFLRAEPIGSVFDFTSWLPSDPNGMNVTADICALDSNNVNKGRPGKENNPSSCFVSRVVCVNNSGTWVQNCADTTVRERYVVTYGGWADCDGTNCNRPRWWPAESVRVRKFERWRKAMANRTRGSISCGTLYKNGATWCIDNGETVFKQEGVASPVCLNPVPSAIIERLPYTDAEKDDLFLCYSKIKPTLRNYVSGMTYFFDGISNIGLGRHTEEKKWQNLSNFAEFPIQSDILSFPVGKAYAELRGTLDTGISLANEYTLTIVADNPTGTAATLLGYIDNNIPTPIFEKVSNNNNDMFQINFHETNPAVIIETACNNHPDKNNNAVTEDRILSWTLVVQHCEDTPAKTCITVYENTTRRDDFTTDNGPVIEGAAGRNLFLRGEGIDKATRIYGIRYYPSVLTPGQILQNFKVDQKRFGISDVKNGRLLGCRVLKKGCPDKDDNGNPNCVEIDAGGE